MKHTNLLLLSSASVWILLSLLLNSCRGGGTFFNATGANNEVLVVMSNDDWESSTGRALFNVLNSQTKALPQPEPNFTILQIEPENFSSTFKMARNIIIPKISERYSQPKLSADLDTYARGQVIMTIQAPDNKSFADFVTENKNAIVDYFITKELVRNGLQQKYEMRDPSERIQEMFGIDIYLPKGLTKVTEHENFYWATNDAATKRKDVVIYQFPYTSADIFNADSLVSIRNRVLGKYIKGSFNSQMSTATAYPPEYRPLEIDGTFRAELRGLWEMTSDMMGGPFVMHALVNENTGKVVVIETFVYSPESNKRNLMRLMEATLYTIGFTKQKAK